MTDDENPPIYVRATAPIRKRLDAQAAHDRRSVSTVVIMALEEFFERHPLPKKGRA